MAKLPPEALHLLGRQLALWRERAGKNQSELARAAGLERTHVNHIEHGRKCLTAQTARRCDDILGTGGALTQLYAYLGQQAELQTSDKLSALKTLTVGEHSFYSGYTDPCLPFFREGIDTGVPIIAFIPTPDGGFRIMTLDRRTLLAGGAASAIGISTASGQVAGTSILSNLKHVDPKALLDHFYTLRKSLGVSDDLFGSRHVVGATMEQLAFLTDLYKNARGQLRTELLKVGACYAEYASLHHNDLGNTQAATYWVDRATEWATEANDRLMVAYVLRRKSFQAAGARDAAAAIGLAQAAQREKPLTARVRALACLEEARGHAFDNNETACQHKLDEAEELMRDGVRHDDIESDLGYFCTHADVYIYRATCAVELNQSHYAIDFFTQGLNALPATHYCDRGEYLSWQAHAHIATNDPEQAVATAQQSLTIVQATGYTRAKNELNRLSTKLTPWSDLPAVQDFTQELTTIQ
jgi:transcriptional regulator with XRE-family HTH domain